jgi:protein XRP2
VAPTPKEEVKVVEKVEPPPKKKFNRLDYMFAKETGKELTKLPGAVDGNPFNIRFLENCTINIFDHSATINVDKCKNCTMFIGPIKSSIFIRDCENCVIHVACQQFRCRDFSNSTIYLYAMNDPVIEASSGLKFAPYNLMYAGLD